MGLRTLPLANRLATDTPGRLPTGSDQVFLVCRRGDTNPKYMEPVERRLRGCLTRNAWSRAYDRVLGTHRRVVP